MTSVQEIWPKLLQMQKNLEDGLVAYLIIVADAADAVSVNFSGRCKFLQI